MRRTMMVGVGVGVLLIVVVGVGLALFALGTRATCACLPLPTVTPRGGGELAERIVFIANDDGAYRDADGNPELYDGGWEVYTIRLDGSDFAQLTQSEHDVDHPMLSPDGTQIVYALWGENYTSTLYVMDVGGSNSHAITDDVTPKGRPQWSPDGTHIAFVNWGDEVHQIVVLDADGANRRVVVEAAVINGDIRWSPDGTQLAFSGSFGGNQNDIYVINADGTDLRTLSDHEAYEGSAQWSVDGAAVVFARAGEVPQHFRVTVADGVIEPLPFMSQFGGEWSADGAQIAMVEGEDYNWRLVVRDADGAQPRTLLTSTLPPFKLSWSADGTQIYYFQEVGEEILHFDIFVIDAAGGEPRRLTFTNSAAIGFEMFP